MDGLLSGNGTEGEPLAAAQAEPTLSEYLPDSSDVMVRPAEATLHEDALQTVGNQAVRSLIKEVTDNGKNLLDEQAIRRHLGVSEVRAQQLISNLLFPLPFLEISGAPVWLVQDVDDWNGRRFGAKD